MSEMVFRHPDLVHLVWVAVGVVGLLGWLELRSRGALLRFLSASMEARLARRQTVARRVVRLALILATLVLGVIAAMRPQSRSEVENRRAQRVEADIMVVLDVSKSMLAEDAAPNRLLRAKAEVDALTEVLDGHRIGLVAFAGRAAVLCPLTPDYGFFRVVLRGVDTDSVSRGGTRIGEALSKAVDAFGAGAGARLLLLITDGEDHDSFPRDAAEKAAERGIRVVAIGFGSEDGSKITITDPETGGKKVLTDRDGNVVISRLDGELLRDIALATEGVYVPAGVAALDLESIVSRHVQPLVRETEVASRTVTVEHYHWFVLAALAALTLAAWVGSTAGRKEAA